MKHHICLLFAVAIMIGLAVSANAGSGIVSLYTVDGSSSVNSVQAGHPVRFLVRYTNDIGIKCDVSTGFRLQSPDGASWDSTTMDSIEPFVNGESNLSKYFSIASAFITPNADGQSPDTVGFLGAGRGTKPLEQLPVGFDDSVFSITAWFSSSSAAGRHICIDSSFCSPGGTWTWVDKNLVNYYPAWNGLTPSQTRTPGFGFCFAIGPDTSVITGHVRRVPSDYATIQAAINASNNGDTIAVSPGVYPENISLMGKNILVSSSGGPGSTTITAADPSQPVVSFTQNEPKGATLRGFTVTGGRASGIFCLNSSPTLLNNWIVGNRSALPNDGAGIALKNTSGSLVRGNVLAHDTANLYGPGVHVGGDGLSSTNDTICYNVFYGNVGIADMRVLGHVTGLHVFNNTMTSNLYISLSVQATGDEDIRNNIVTGSTAWGIYVNNFPSIATCSYNCVFGNVYDFLNITAGPGNIEVDPLFVDAAHNDYHLQASSPCINAGDPAAIFNDPDGSRNDIGAFPFTGGPQPTADTLRVPQDRATIQAAINDVKNGGAVLVSAGVYVENISFSGKRIRVTGVAGPDSTTIQAADPTLAVVSFTHSEPKGAALNGFTITGSHYGGIEAIGSSPTITGNRIVNNRSSRENNGAGVSLKNTVSSLIKGNVIAYDTALVYGPGIHVGGNGMTTQNDTICFNIFYGNSGTNEIRVLGAATDLKIFNNTLTSATNFGIGINTTGTEDIRNNIITGVTGYAIAVVYFPAVAVCEYNCLFNNEANFEGVTVGAGNVFSDPKFVNLASHDLRLQSNSPCIDAGDPASIFNDPNGSRDDIGAIPFVGGPQPGTDTLRVPADRATIQAAINDIKDGGTVLVSPGSYTGGLVVTGKGVHIKSTGGPDGTTITAPDNVDLAVFIGPEASLSLLEGFTLLGGHIGVWCQNSGPTIRHNILAYQHVTNWAAICLAGPGFPSATYGASPAVIENNTIIHAANGGISTFSTVAPFIRNNIIAFSAYYGVHRQDNNIPLIANYNDIFGNPTPYFNFPISTGNILVDPKLDAAYHLMAGSPCIDAGNPDPSYNDPDGTRNDIGAIPFGGNGNPDPIPTNEWVILYCPHAFLDSNPLPPGAVLTAYDPQGVLCGKAIVDTVGKFGPMLVYADDSYTSIDEGAKPGDVISFKLNGQPVFPTSPVIWTRNGDLFQVCAFQSGICQQIPIHSGWNLISWNVGFDGTTENLIAGIKGCVDLMLSYDQGGLVYLPDLPDFSTLTNVDHHHGYWIKANCSTTLTVCGAPTGCGDIISIAPGWNLVSYLPTASTSVQTGWATILGNLQVALGYDNGGKTYLPGNPQFNTLTNLDPGFGYWIRSNASTTLRYFRCGDSVERNTPTPVVAATTPLGSRFWMSVYGSGITLDGTPLANGSTTIELVTADNVVVGHSTYSNGVLKFTSAYGADEQDPATKAFPKNGDKLLVTVNGVKTDPAITWTGHGTLQRLTQLTTSTDGNLPREYSLAQNYPNPFNPQTTIEFAIPTPSRVRIVVYNLLGQSIKTLVDADYAAGNFKLVWNGTDASGSPVASGVYLYRIEANNYSSSKKMLLLK